MFKFILVSRIILSSNFVLWAARNSTTAHKWKRHQNHNSFLMLSQDNIEFSISGLFEKSVHDELFEFLTTNSLLSSNQFAYHKLHSMITSLMNVKDTWYKNIEEKRINVSLYLDLRKSSTHLFKRKMKTHLLGQSMEPLQHRRQILIG